jgi:hypothetical protein
MTQRELFIRIWMTRPRRSQVSDVKLGPDMCAWMFSHVLPKSTYPAGKVDEENIVLMTFDEHQKWEHHQSELLFTKRWKWVFELKEKLKNKYNQPESISRGLPAAKA